MKVRSEDHPDVLIINKYYEMIFFYARQTGNIYRKGVLTGVVLVCDRTTTIIDVLQGYADILVSFSVSSSRLF